MARLTPLAHLRARQRVATPVIVEAEQSRLVDLFSEAREYELLERAADMGRRILQRLRDAMPFATSRRFDRFNMFSGFFPRNFIWQLAEDRRVKNIYSDEPMYALSQYPTTEAIFKKQYGKKKERFTSTYWTKQLIGANEANSEGYNGSGQKVAIIDSGIAHYHEQVARADFETVQKGQHNDKNGHGTWCVSCVGGTRAEDDRMSRRVGNQVLCEGMAPKSHLLCIKALGYVIGTGSTSQIINGIEYAIDHGSNVLSMSLGGSATEQEPEESPYYKPFKEAKKEKVIPVVAAGNSGDAENSIGSPGDLPNVLTVGAWDPRNGEVAKFSSRGPTNWDSTKPDVMAPGVKINSASTGALDLADKLANRYTAISGTSMATPHVAGLVALMQEAVKKNTNGTLTIEHIKEMMKAYGKDKDNTNGWGKITWSMFKNWMSTEYGVKV